jgi:hypothetical protein
MGQSLYELGEIRLERTKMFGSIAVHLVATALDEIAEGSSFLVKEKMVDQ